MADILNATQHFAPVGTFRLHVIRLVGSINTYLYSMSDLALRSSLIGRKELYVSLTMD